MAKMVTTYLVVVLLVSLGFFGVGALASAVEPPVAEALDDLLPGTLASSRASTGIIGFQPDHAHFPAGRTRHPAGE